MPLDYFRLPVFQPGGTGIGQLGEDFYEAAKAFSEGRHRKRQEELAAARQRAIEEHQRQMEALGQRTADTAEKRQLAAEDFTRRQSQVAERRAGAQESRDALTFEQGQADRRSATVRNIGRAYGQGLPTQAQALAGASQFTDPRTGERQGVQLEPIQTPPDSGMAMPLEPKQPEFVGPLEDPESARARAIGKVYGVSAPAGQQLEPPQFDPAKADEAERAGAAAESEVRGQQALRDQYGRESAAYPGQRAAFDEAAREHAERVADPRYRATFPGGESVEIDPREERKSVIAEAKEKADRLRQGAAQQPPDVARAMMLQADMIESTISNADKAPVTNMNASVQAQGFKAGEADKDRAVKREAIRARKAGKGGGAGSGVPSAGDQRVLTEMDKSLEPVTRKGGVRDSLVQSQNTLEALKQDPNNPVNWVNAIDAAVRTNTGRAAIKAQFDLYMGHAHGTVDEFSAWMNRFRSGLPSPEQRQNLLGAFNQANSELRAQSKEAFDNFRRYDQDPRVKKMAIGLGYQARERNTFGTMPGYAKPGGQAPARAGGVPPAIRAKAEKALNDPNAPPAAKAAARKVLGL